jgi:serine/threonine protein kinase
LGFGFGPYQLLKRLGEGTSGDVHLARPIRPDRALPPLLVIKRLKDEVSKEDRFIRRFIHEVTIATAIDSPYIARVFDSGKVGETLYIAMEYIAGWPLVQVLEDRMLRREPLRLTTAVVIAQQCLQGLRVLHEAADQEGVPLEVVHRDIAPKNIMLGEDGLARLIDLGLGKSRLREWRTQTGMLMGTPGYMAPEQAAGEHADLRADLYAVGVMLFELITLEPYIQPGPLVEMLRAAFEKPFRPTSWIRTDVPDALDEVLARALAVSRNDRFGSAAEFARALEAAVPMPQEPESIHALVGESLWTEHADQRARMLELLDATKVLDPNGPIEKTEVIARRAATELDERSHKTEIKRPTVSRPNGRGGPIAAAVLGTILLGAAGVAGGILIERSHDAEIEVVTDLAADAPPEIAPARPSAAQRSQIDRDAEPDEAQGPGEPTPRGKTQARRTRPASPSTRGPDSRAPDPRAHEDRGGALGADRPKEETPLGPRTDDSLDSLISRARALNKRRAGDERVIALLTELQELASQRSQDRDPKRVKSLAAQLTALEAG